jgi:hypothetical protein
MSYGRHILLYTHIASEEAKRKRRSRLFADERQRSEKYSRAREINEVVFK